MSRMIKSGSELQREVFDQPARQYQQESIIHPPPHTESETLSVVSRLRNRVDIRTDTVIDFGAGTGRLTIPLLREGFRVLPVDVSLESLDRLKALAHRLALPLDEVQDSLPQNARYAAVAGADILHHVPLDEYLPIIFQALRPGGCIVFSEPGAFNPSWYLYVTLFVGWKAEKRLVTTNIPYLNAKLRQHGFRDVRIMGLGLLPRSLFNKSPAFMKYNDIFGNLPAIKLIAYRYIIEATR